MGKRKTTGKRLRFAIFARDSFTCRYCGRQSDEVKLVLDHIVPVSAGGPTNEENLVTSCEDCNQGKADKVLTAIPDLDRLARLQELQEQRAVADASAAAMRADKEAFQSFVNFWCSCTGRENVETKTITTVYSFVREYGMPTVCEWVRMAAWRVGPAKDRNIGKYVSGIRRALRAEEKAA